MLCGRRVARIKHLGRFKLCRVFAVWSCKDFFNVLIMTISMPLNCRIGRVLQREACQRIRGRYV